jgi:aminoglycoside phosphotransferase (APT) family kinase protein
MEINVSLVKQLVAEQFPEWTQLPIEPVELSGWDNRTFHLGQKMMVRLPSAEGYTPQVEKEHRWLPRLAQHLPLPVPKPVAMGKPSKDYPWPWSIYQWIEGETASAERIEDIGQFASELAQFLSDLQQIDATGGPRAGAHSFYRGAPLVVYDGETRIAIEKLEGEIDQPTVTSLWEEATRTEWQKPPLWFHGDVAEGNLLVKNGKLSAVIDFGCAGIGDPACDLTIAWTFLYGESREVFRKALPLDHTTWVRGRGWALWKALITVLEYRNSDPVKAEKSRRVIDEVLDDHIKNAALPVRKC